MSWLEERAAAADKNDRSVEGGGVPTSTGDCYWLVGKVGRRAERIDLVRAMAHRFADAKLEIPVKIGQRTLLLPVSASWAVFQFLPPLEDLIRVVEAFIAVQLSSAELQ